jgi:hypothetical protein
MRSVTSVGRIPERIRWADPLQSKVAALVCHFGRRREASPKGDAGVWGAEHFAAPQLND